MRGVFSADFREYPEIEHLAIVQVALSDVFKFFDRTAAGPEGNGKTIPV